MSRCGYTVSNAGSPEQTWRCSMLDGHQGNHYFGVLNETIEVAEVDLNSAFDKGTPLKIGSRYWQLVTYTTTNLGSGPYAGRTAMSMMLVEVKP